MLYGLKHFTFDGHDDIIISLHKIIDHHCYYDSTAMLLLF